MYILSVRVDNVSAIIALEKVKDFFSLNGQHMIFTPNPEMLVAAHKDLYFQEVLNKGDINICDGKGIALVSKEKIERIPGVDFMLSVCALAEKENKTVYLLGSGKKSVVDNCKKNLQQQFPFLQIVGAHHGPFLVEKKVVDILKISVEEEENNAVLENIILCAPDILFVAFGHSKQEKWIYEFLPELPSVKVAMGVGGSFDYIAGKIKRAPKIFRTLGLEWLYRMIREPRRIKRIWKATVVFLFLYLKNK